LITLTVMLRLFVAVLLAESVTFTVNDELAAVVGVPVIWPALLSDNPAGSEPELSDHV